MQPSSRTPEGEPNRCPVCGKTLHIEPSRPPGDAPCPHCGHPLLFGLRTDGGAVPTKLAQRSGRGAGRAGAFDAMAGGHADARETSWLPPRSLSNSPPVGAMGEEQGLSGAARDDWATAVPSRSWTAATRKTRSDNRPRRQVSATAWLDHPNIFRGHDFDKDVRYGQPIAFLVMDYIEGRDLRRMVTEDGPLGFRKAADLISQAANGLAHAHRPGFIHRNIEPANLLIDLVGVVKIIGFVGFVPADFAFPASTARGRAAFADRRGKAVAHGAFQLPRPEQCRSQKSRHGR